MTILHPIDALMSVAKSAWDLRDRFAAVPETERGAIAEYYTGFGQTVTQLADCLRAGSSLDRVCDDLCGRVQQFRSIADPVFGTTTADDLYRRLESTYQPQLILDDVGRASDPAAEVRRLDEAAGIYRAVGQAAVGVPERSSGRSNLSG